MEPLKDEYPEYQKKSSNSKRDKSLSGKEYKQTIYKEPHIWKDAAVQFSHSVMSNSLWPQGPQHARLPCLPPIPRAYSNPCLSNRWCHPTISSSVIPFSSHLQSSPASGSFQMSQFFASGSQSIGVSASASVLPMNIQDWSPLRWTGWISLLFKGLSRVFSNTTVHKSINSSVLSFLYSPNITSIHDYWKNQSLDLDGPLLVMSLFFNMLSRLVTTFLPRSKRLLISGCGNHLQWFWSPPKIKSATVSTLYPSICHEVMGPMAY